MAGRQVVTSLPAIRVPIGHQPQRLKTLKIAVERSRLNILRRIVTRLVREERCELSQNRAFEARPYLERLLQLGIYRGPKDDYTKEMTDWWLAEEDLRTKFYDVLVPRFKGQEEPFTRIYTLPSERVVYFQRGRNVKDRPLNIAVLELKGNPFPPVVPEPIDHSSTLLSILLKNALQKRLTPVGSTNS